MIPIPLSPFTIAVLVAGALSVTNYITFHLWQGAKDDLVLYEAQVRAASAEADAINQRKIADAEKNTGEVARLYGLRIADLERSFSSRLRREAGARETMSRTAEATAGVGLRPTDDGLDRAFIEVCERLEKDCAITTLKWYHLKQWVIGVCK